MRKNDLSTGAIWLFCYASKKDQVMPNKAVLYLHNFCPQIKSSIEKKQSIAVILLGIQYRPHCVEIAVKRVLLICCANLSTNIVWPGPFTIFCNQLQV